MLQFVVTSCSHVVMLHHDVINDIIWHMHWAYKRPGSCIIRGSLLVHLEMGKEVHVHT